MRKIVQFLVMALFFIGSITIFTPVNDNTSIHTIQNSIVSTNESVVMDEIAAPLGSSSIKILYPLSTFPAIVEKGDNFTLKVNVSHSPQKWEIILSTAYDIVWDEIPLQVMSMEYNTTSHLWNIMARIPPSTDEELYNITVKVITDQGYLEATEPRAVCVKEISDNFSFVHLTDFHIGDPRGMKVDIKQTIGWKAAKKCISEINLLNPDFVVITGDLLFGQLYPLEYSFEYRKCYEILQLFEVPTFVCPGNHDGYIQSGQDGFVLWQKFFGPLYYSLDYGNSHFTMVNSYDWPAKSRIAFSYLAFNWGGYIGEKQMKWIERDLQNSMNAKLKFILLHHNPLWDTKNDSLLKNGYEGREELLFLIEKYEIDAVLAGHVHYDDITIQNNTLYITTTTAASDLGSEDAYWGYRLLTIKGGEIGSYNYKGKYSIPSYRLNYTYTLNDGSMDTVSVEIENDLEMGVEATVHFYVPLGNYEVENGEVFMERSREGIMEVYVRASIDALSSKEVSIHPA